MSSQPRISIIIVSWNGRDLVERCLASLDRHVSVSHEIIVVDNHSSDGTPAMIAERFPTVRLIKNTTNRGFSAANNQGLQVATSEVVCFFNPDTEVHNDPFPALLEQLADQVCGAVAPRLLNLDGTIQDSLRHWPRWPDQVATLLKLRHFLKQSYFFQRYYDRRSQTAVEPIVVDEAMGAALIIKKDVLKKIGGWDEQYWIWFEDVDLCHRLRRAGWEVRYVPTATVTHLGGSSFGTVLSLRKQLWFMRSLWRYAWRFWSPLVAASLLVVFPVSYLLTILQMIVKPR